MTAQEYNRLYKTKQFQNEFMYDGPLGPVCTAAGTSLTVWSPAADKISLNLYRDGLEGEPYAAFKMLPSEKGAWVWHTEECLHGIYYDLCLTIGGETKTARDPYARACGPNGCRDMFIDMEKTDPAGWEDDHAPEKPLSPVIYELHVKEFSWDPEGGFPEALRGKYLAFTDRGSRGMRYLKSLGVTHVQLMPVYDFGSVDETADTEQSNWGYDPMNYNIPEGSYATDAHRGEVRVRECKEMIRALHESGLRVVMDVVYNHTYSLNTALQETAPWYFYRTDANGVLSNGSGCGNDIATERPMCARYILDSVLYWAEEYHIDGFRFDLMGLMDVRLMNRIRKALDEKFGAGEKTVYGEPWAAGPTAVEGKKVMLASRAHFPHVSKGIGLFNDDIRDAVKGSVFDSEDCGFVNGGKGLEGRIAEGVMAGRNSDPGCGIKAAGQTITYVSAHDNHTLWDKLTITTPDPLLRRRQNRLAAAICMTCQGIPFLLSGEEFLRTKNGLDNSYDASIEINRLDWSLTERNKDMLDYYRGLIGLRRHFPGLYDPSAKAFTRVRILEAAKGVVMFTVDNTPSKEWRQLCIIYNRRQKKIRRRLPPGEWELLADGENSFLWKADRRAAYKGAADIAPVSAFIFGQCI